MPQSLYRPLGGKTRRYEHITTGETISRYQYDKLRGIDWKKRAKQSKIENLEKALARPARGRKAAKTTRTAKRRATRYLETKQLSAIERLEQQAAKDLKRAKPKVIRKQLLKAGKKAAQINIRDYDDYKNAVEQMRNQRLANGKYLVSYYSIGVVGYDENTGEERGATVIAAQSPSVLLSREEFSDETTGFLESRSYFIFRNWFMHLHFNNEYAREKMNNEQTKKQTKIFR